MEKQIKLTLTQARNLYKSNPEYRDTLLSVFTDKELGIKSGYPKSFNDLEEIQGFWIDKNSNIESFSSQDPLMDFDKIKDKNVFATEKQAKSALAFAQLSQLAKKMNGYWAIDWNNSSQTKHTIFRTMNGLHLSNYTIVYKSIVFQTKEMAEFSLKHHEQLWKDYYELD